MKATINSKRYNTDNLDVCGHRDHYNNGTYSGTTYLGVHQDGTVIVWTVANGNDLWVTDGIHEADASDQIDQYDMTEAEEANAIKHGLITLA